MEYVDIYDRRREKTGRTKERHELEEGEYRLSAHIWILDKGKMLVQQRALTSKRFAGLWSQTAGGVDAGETSLQACVRECKEEVGLDVKKENITYVGSFEREKDIVDIFLVEQKVNVKKLVRQESEVNAIKMVTFEEFDKMIENGEVVPSINPSYHLLKNFVKNYR